MAKAFRVRIFTLLRIQFNLVVRGQAGQFLVTGQVPHLFAAHTASDIPPSAFGQWARLSGSPMDSTEVFFRVTQDVLGVVR